MRATIQHHGGNQASTVAIELAVPRDILLAADISENYAAADIKKHLAVHLFKERVLSFGKACELACLSKHSFMDLIGSKGISLNYDEDDYMEDLRAIKGLGL